MTVVAALWILLLGFAVWHSWAMASYLRRVSAERFETGGTVETIRGQIPLGTAFDAQTWIRLSEDMSRSGDWRLRTATHENVPEGRPVFWASGWSWWLIACGKIWAAVTGENFGPAIERAAMWANLPVLLLTVAGAAWWAARRWGAIVALALAGLMLGHRGFYAGYYPGNPDHHGFVAGCAAFMLLGLARGGWGWYRCGSVDGAKGGAWFPVDENAVRRSFVVSAVFGALGMWFSAAALIPVMGACAMAVLLCGQPTGNGLRISGSAWRLWGRAGGGATLAFYLLEQFPDRLGWRMEVNHPLFASAWWCGAELIAWRLERGQTGKRLGWGRGLAMIVGLMSPAVVVALGGASVFGLVDGFMSGAHAGVTELESMPHRIAVLGWRHYAGYALLEPVFFTVALGLAFRWRLRPAGHPLRVALVVALLLLGLGWWQNRWMLLVGAPLALVGGIWIREARGRASVAGQWMSAVILSVVALWHPCQLLVERLAVSQRRDVQLGEARQLLYREVARVLRADAGSGRDVLLLAAPDASTAVSYFGDLDALGTMYWENRPGLWRASRILAATDEHEAAELARRWGVTHVALFGSDGGGAVYDFAKGGAGPAVGARWLADQTEAVWLRPIVYSIPPQFGRVETRVRLYAVDFSQSEAEAAYRHGLAALAYRELPRATRCFEHAASLSPTSPAPWMRVAELRLLTRDFQGALTAMLTGVGNLPTEQRENAYTDAARLFAAHGASVQADRLLDRAVAAGGR